MGKQKNWLKQFLVYTLIMVLAFTSNTQFVFANELNKLIEDHTEVDQNESKEQIENKEQLEDQIEPDSISPPSLNDQNQKDELVDNIIIK